MPWNYHDLFFQEPPALGGGILDAPYSGLDVVDLSRRFYAGLGLSVDPILARSDLYERPGKSPHAFCTDIDRQGDVRVLANVVPTEYWASTMLHELGHGVYSSLFIPRELPYTVRAESHILTTEGIAMLFELFSKNAAWLTRMGVVVPDVGAFDRAARQTLREGLLVFSRWAQVMYRFEKAMYEHPEADLSDLWWSLVERYQLVGRPPGRQAPDYASKIHIVAAPAYYHNYMLGRLFASQLHHAIAREVLHATPSQALYVDRRDVGDFLRARVFAPGRTLRWDALTRFATGDELSARAFAADFGN